MKKKRQRRIWRWGFWENEGQYPLKVQDIFLVLVFKRTKTRLKTKRKGLVRYGLKTVIGLPFPFASSSSSCSSSLSSSSSSSSSSPSASSCQSYYNDMFPLPIYLHLLPDPCVVALIHPILLCVLIRLNFNQYCSSYSLCLASKTKKKKQNYVRIREKGKADKSLKSKIDNKNRLI